MAESAGVPGGWEAYSSMNQQDRNSWRSTAVSLGRELSSTPTHLTRVLYIPRHDRQTSELSLYDITQEYGRAVGDVPMGSSMYTVKLEMAKVPKTEKEGGNPEYQIGFTEDNQNGEVVVGSVRNMSTLAEVEMKIETATEEEAAILTLKNRNPTSSTTSPEQFPSPIAMDITYPIPPSKTRDGEVKHPYFSFQVPGQAGTTEFQWQIHPVENGSLRYTLVRIPQSGAADGQGSEVQKVEVEAIYYHIGVGASLSLPYSEGVLLLRSPSFADAGAEALVVGSMLGMLWRLRELDEDGKGKKSRFSGLKGLMKGK